MGLPRLDVFAAGERRFASARAGLADVVNL